MARDDQPRDEDRSEARRRRSRKERLDVPRDTRRQIVKRPEYDPEMFGRFAERFARFMGTARFLIYMTLFVAVWLLWNWLAPPDMRWDDYPFIFLTLMLSLQASYAAPLILLAQNRQEARDRVIYERDREANVQARADMEYLAREVASLRMAVGEIATRDFLRSELRALQADLDERSHADSADHDSDGSRSSRSLDA
jgi:uncharacterized membrane protein